MMPVVKRPVPWALQYSQTRYCQRALDNALKSKVLRSSFRVGKQIQGVERHVISEF